MKYFAYVGINAQYSESQVNMLPLRWTSLMPKSTLRREAQHSNKSIEPLSTATSNLVMCSYHRCYDTWTEQTAHEYRHSCTRGIYLLAQAKRIKT